MQRVLKSLINFANNHKNSTWRDKNLNKSDLSIVYENYSHFLRDVYDFVAHTQPNKDKKIFKLVTLEEAKQLFVSAGLKRTKEAANDINTIFLNSKALEIEDGVIEFGLTFVEFVELLIRSSQIIWIPPVSAPNH